MIIDKETGDIIFGPDQILKARMSVEEIKESKIMELVTEEGARKLEEGYGTSLKVTNAHGHTVYLRVHMYDGRVSRIYMTLQDFYDFYDKYAYNVEEFEKVIIIQREFLEKVLLEDIVPNESRYKWGKIEMRVCYRDTNDLSIHILYRR